MLHLIVLALAALTSLPSFAANSLKDSETAMVTINPLSDGPDRVIFLGPKVRDWNEAKHFCSGLNTIIGYWDLPSPFEFFLVTASGYSQRIREYEALNEEGASLGILNSYGWTRLRRSQNALYRSGSSHSSILMNGYRFPSGFNFKHLSYEDIVPRERFSYMGSLEKIGLAKDSHDAFTAHRLGGIQVSVGRTEELRHTTNQLKSELESHALTMEEKKVKVKRLKEIDSRLRVFGEGAQVICIKKNKLFEDPFAY